MRLETPEKIRDLQRGLYLKAKREPRSLVYMPSRSMPRIGGLVCLEGKMIGKPYVGELQVRFDEGGLDGCLWATPNGHEAGNGGYSQGLA